MAEIRGDVQRLISLKALLEEQTGAMAAELDKAATVVTTLKGMWSGAAGDCFAVSLSTVLLSLREVREAYGSLGNWSGEIADAYTNALMQDQEEIGQIRIS